MVYSQEVSKVMTARSFAHKTTALQIANRRASILNSILFSFVAEYYGLPLRTLLYSTVYCSFDHTKNLCTSKQKINKCKMMISSNGTQKA